MAVKRKGESVMSLEKKLATAKAKEAQRAKIAALRSELSKLTRKAK